MSEPETQSPANIVGPHKIATSLWLRFFALPQSVPGFAVAHRRRGPPVMNVIDRLPPRSDCYNIGATSRVRTRGSIRLRDTVTRERRYSLLIPNPRAPIHDSFSLRRETRGFKRVERRIGALLRKPVDYEERFQVVDPRRYGIMRCALLMRAARRSSWG